MNNLSIKLALLTFLLSLTACSWVKPIPGADEVVLLKLQDVEHCTRIGTTHTQTLDRFGLLDRNETTIQQELVKLAQNDAVRLRGDTIVAISPLKEGMMTFAIYRCR